MLTYKQLKQVMRSEQKGNMGYLKYKGAMNVKFTKMKEIGDFLSMMKDDLDPEGVLFSYFHWYERLE